MLLRERRGPTSMGSKVVRCGKRERHKHSMRNCCTWDNKKRNILIPSCYSHKTPNPLLFTLSPKLWYSLARLLPCFPLHVLSIYLTSLPHLSSSLPTPTNPLKTSLPISLWVSILANSWSTPLTSLSLKIEFVRSLRTPFYLRVLPRIPPANDHCTHFLIFYINPAEWLRHIPERYTRHVLAETSCVTREISAHGAWPHVTFRIKKKSQSGDHP